jgi:ABC-type antimicrobial peptide transport system permease subunit
VAIGANPASVAWTIIKESSRLTLFGLAIGVPLAFLASQSLRSLLFGITESDALTFVVVGLVFLLVGITAGIAPARRALKIDPVTALRTE